MRGLATLFRRYNGAAKTALAYAGRAARALGEDPNPRWAMVAEGSRVLRTPDGTTKEHADYAGEIIKQADVNLLSYPLDVVSDRESILRDLRYYEPKLSPEGPAMGKSIFAVLYARLGCYEEWSQVRGRWVGQSSSTELVSQRGRLK